jgi:hypothetical protein
VRTSRKRSCRIAASASGISRSSFITRSPPRFIDRSAAGRGRRPMRSGRAASQEDEKLIANC